MFLVCIWFVGIFLQKKNQLTEICFYTSNIPLDYFIIHSFILACDVVELQFPFLPTLQICLLFQSKYTEYSFLTSIFLQDGFFCSLHFGGGCIGNLWDLLFGGIVLVGLFVFFPGFCFIISSIFFLNLFLFLLKLHNRCLRTLLKIWPFICT